MIRKKLVSIRSAAGIYQLCRSDMLTHYPPGILGHMFGCSGTLCRRSGILTRMFGCSGTLCRRSGILTHMFGCSGTLCRRSGMLTHMFRRCAALTLIFCLSAALIPFNIAARATGDSPGSHERAEKLYHLHLFRGTDTLPDGSPVFALDEKPSRLQGVILLVRLLGAEEDALAISPYTPFDDVAGDGAPYVAYAYRNGITKGTSETTFSPSEPLTSRAFVTFLLRALGYQDTDGDFPWGGQMDFAASLGMITHRTAAMLEHIHLNRGDLADLCYAALTCPCRDENQTLAESLMNKGVFTEAEGIQAGVLGSNAGWTLEYTPPENSPLGYDTRTIAGETDPVDAHILTVNTTDSRVSVRTALTGGVLGQTAPFTQIVRDTAPAAAVNANPFISGTSRMPLGNVMSDGAFVYAEETGMTALGITQAGELRMGAPIISVLLKSIGSEWSVYEINTYEQNSSSSVLYTPAYGERVVMQDDGWALKADSGVITEFYSVSKGASVAIPRDGFVVYMGFAYASAVWFRIPQKGAAISMEYAVKDADRDNSFALDGVVNLISGKTRLIRNGAAVKDETSGESESESTAVLPRTAAGIRRDGRLVLVSVPDGTDAASLTDLLLELGCTDAVDLDDGTACGMYYDGSFLASPARNLSVTLQIFLEN